MNERLARILLGASVRATRELGVIPQLLAQHGAEQDRDDFRDPVGSAIYQIMEEITEPLLERFPGLRAEFEANLKEYGCFS